MLHEFDKPIEKTNADDYGQDPEVPILRQSAKARSYHDYAAKERNSPARYIGLAFNRMRRFSLGVWDFSKSHSLWTAVATVVIAWATVKYTQYAEKQWDTMVNQTRPWIKVTAVELRPGIGPISTLGFHWPLTGAIVPPMLQFKVSMLNVGHSPAQSIDVIPEFFLGKFSSDKWHETVSNEQQRFCKFAIGQKPSGAANILFAGDPSEQEMGAGGIVHDTDIIHISGNPESFVAASLILCINYTGGGSSPYQTQARFTLSEDNRNLIMVGVDADADRLKLIREPNGDHAN